MAVLASSLIPVGSAVSEDTAHSPNLSSVCCQLLEKSWGKAVCDANLLVQEEQCIISLMEELSSPPLLGNGTEDICLFWFEFCPNLSPVSADVLELPAMSLGRSQEDNEHSGFTIPTLRRSSEDQATKESRFLHLCDLRYFRNPQRSNWYRWKNLDVYYRVLKWTFMFSHES